MIIVGGLYEERVVVPGRQQLAGSGLRAASVLQAGQQVRLVSAVDPGTLSLADSVLATNRVAATMIERDHLVGFSYFSPIVPASSYGLPCLLKEALASEDEAALVFGMVESGRYEVRAERLVFDPQAPRGPVGLELDGLEYNELCILANAREVRALSPGAIDLESAALRLLANHDAAAVIVKDSARGCLVATRNSRSIERVGPHPTDRVWPLGSGDVFAAGYAHAWTRGAHPVDAARVGSSSAAWWCATQGATVPLAILGGAPVNDVLRSAEPELSVSEQPPLIYLAGPFFSIAQVWLVQVCRRALQGLGARVFSPMDDVGFGGDEVAQQDLEGLASADAVLALLDGWDAGTVYEVGWAHRHNLPVVGYLQAAGEENKKMLVGGGADLCDDLPTALYHAVWAGQKRLYSRTTPAS